MAASIDESADSQTDDARASFGGLMDAPRVFAMEIDRRLPELSSRCEGVTAALASFLFVEQPTAIDTPGSLATIMTQAHNEFVDLLYDATCGRGRTALKNARSLFELLVTLLDCYAVPEMDARYKRHVSVAQQLEASLEEEIAELTGKERKALIHARRKLARDTRQEYDAVLKDYGASCARNWTSKGLKDRAVEHGLGGYYDFYRLSSTILHGAAGGALGLVRQVGDGPVHRNGVALALCPMALLYGLIFYDRILAAFADGHPSPTLETLRGELKNVRRMWPDYRRVVLKLDSEVWPVLPPPGAVAVFAIGPFNTGTWYLHDPERGRIILAETPTEVEPEQQASLARLREAFAEDWSDQDRLGGSGLISVAMAGASGLARGQHGCTTVGFSCSCHLSARDPNWSPKSLELDEEFTARNLRNWRPPEQ